DTTARWVWTLKNGICYQRPSFAPKAELQTKSTSLVFTHFFAKTSTDRSFCRKSWIWKAFGPFRNARDDVRALSQGPVYVDILRGWAANGESHRLSEIRSGIVALPLLIILQIGQYLRYLEFHGLAHQEFLAEIRHAGGAQGYCGGLPSAIALACARDETEVVMNAGIAMRILLGIGAYGEAADEGNGTGTTTLALRLKYEGQGDELARLFPGTHVSAITDPKSVSMVGPAQKLEEVFNYAQGQGLQVQKMDIRGKVHNPENRDLAIELCQLCNETPCLQLPEASALQVPVRSNRSGEKLLHGSLTDEIVTTILASRCDWYVLLNEVAEDLAASKQPAHTFVIFGLNDCVPMSPFHKQRLQSTKFQAHRLIEKVRKPKNHDNIPLDSSFFQDSAIAVVGASCRLPGADNLEELWDLLASGADRHQEVPADRFDLHGSFRASQSGGFAGGRKFYGNFLDDVQRFDNSFFGINPREAANLDPQQRILLELSFEALDASGYLSKHRREAGDNVGCFIGASLVEYLDNTNAHGPTAYTSTGTIRAFLCGRLSHYYGWRGPSEVIDTACSSSGVAINRACKAIQTGECNMALAGGVNIITGINNYLDLGKAGFLSPTGQCKPFDQSADGYCRSDGAGLVVLKKLKQAISDGDHILGVIPGIATNQGGLSTSITVPDSGAQQALYQKVVQQSGLQTDQVTYIESHGTGTQAGDPLEMDSIRSVFGSPSRSDTAYVGSIKGNIGHCETAAGVASLLKVLAMIKHGQLPPQTNHQRLNPKIPSLKEDGLDIIQSLRPWDAPFRAALVNSYGAAGSNCALLCCEMPQQETNKSYVTSSPMSFPIILSAASQETLLDSARALGKHLRKDSTNLKIGDISFTLNEKRQRHKYCMSTTSTSSNDLAKQLLSLETSACFEFCKSSRPIVLCFSGQSSNKVVLDKTLYESFPGFRHFIDACDIQIQALGFASILPAIFQKEPIVDVVTLQCSIFAMQYACAQCWIESGLKIGAIIGHSLGELTALAVSGVLSLSDSIKLVASRGRLIESQWGPEKGAMLALQCDIRGFEEIQGSLQDGHVEIACHNAPASLVAVGTSATIDAVENMLRTQPSLQKIRSQRLETSHGFHSTLVEPILADLTTISDSLNWNEPNIPLEVCTEESIPSMQNYSVSKHAREPVFFSNAVRRLENSLGACVWLEAGVDTPVIPMIRKATKQPNIHSFHAIKTQGERKSVDAVSGIVSALWKSGISSTYWGFLPMHARQYKQVWLPPYQFKKTPHWRENVDRTIEMQQKLLTSDSVTATVDILQALPQLITRRAATNEVPGVAEFLVNTQSQRFRKIVGGHAVRERPLCPASLYMECATMAIQLLTGDAENASLVFEKVDFHSALGLDSGNEVVIRLEEVSNGQSWKFNIRSSMPTNPRPRQITHGNGLISRDPNHIPSMFQRLVSGPTERLEKKEDAEKLMSKRAYGLFALVVDYAPFFQGIHAITLDDWEAIATISLPENQPHREESTSWKICDTVTIDSFIQVVGLLMNSSDVVSRGEVMVMVGIERAVISPACKMDGKMRWQVYAKFSFNQGQPIGDVFVSSPEGELVAMLCGCRFTKILILKLEKALDSANSTVPPEVTPRKETPRNELSAGSITTSEGFSTPATSTPAQDSSDSVLRDLIAEYTGVNRLDICQHTIFADLGLDSLASVELVSELLSKFGLVITSDDLVTSTLHSLNQALGISGSGSVNIESNKPRTGDYVSPNSTDSPLYDLPEQESDGRRRQHFLQILAEISGAKFEDIEPPNALADLGIDSLSSVDLKQELEDAFSVRLDDFDLDCTVSELSTRLKINGSNLQAPGLSLNLPRTDAVVPRSAPQQKESAVLPNPFDALKQSDTCFDASAKKQGFLRYWSDVAPLQDELLLAYIVEGFCTLGVDFSRILPGNYVPQVPHMVQKYDKLMQRLWEILQKHHIVFIDEEGDVVRGSRPIDPRSSSRLAELFRAQFPDYEHETNLISLTGPRLADCLSGKADPVSIMFGSPSSLKIMENFYGQSPMMSTLTEQLVIFMTTLLQNQDVSQPVRILEVGAGTGGTTKRLAEALDAAGIKAQYTFTDISPSLVAKAKNKFKQYPWIEFATFNLEKEVPAAFQNRFDVVVSANCVHATTNRTASCRRLREVLNEDGFIVLSEVTRVMDWYDICFGLLDGWWLAEGRKAYPLQPAEAWMSTFEAAGFASTGYSHGPTLEANSQQLLVASRKPWGYPAVMENIPDTPGGQNGAHSMETMTYKEVGDVQIHADVYFPLRTPPSPMPIALMIHGGGFMTLSRKAIRPIQTQHLLANGFLPVSIDYRLCPEINIIDGPMADVCDAYKWAQTSLPEIASQRGIAVDQNKVVVVGWSTGGHLAMSLGWTAKMAGLQPPMAVLSFYAPVDFESGDLDASRLSELPDRSMSMERIMAALPTTPITNYSSAKADRTGLGWVRPGDPRSELVMALFKEGIGLPLLLNGLPDATTPPSEWFSRPSPAQAASISPLAQIRAGAYDTPTFIIHGTCDQIAPFAGAERFVGELRERGIRHGFLPLEGVDHMHDLRLRPGSGEWDAQVGPGYQFLFDVVRRHT
ncbi:3-methylorcinaldehyde synthase, partial [Lachnellula occidentalis]